MSSYKEAIAWLDDHHPFFVTPLLNLGTPREDTSVDTLAVQKIGKDIQLMINPDFLDEHTTEECAGLLSHELYHVVMNHLGEQDKFEHEQVMVIAQECIVNDSVLEEGMSLPDSAILGMNYVEYNTSFLPTKIVYDDLLKKLDPLPEKSERNCSHTSGEGLDQREIFNKIFNNADIEEAPESLKVMLENAASKAGSGFSFQKTTKSGRKISLKWTELINKIHPNTFSDGGRSKSSGTWSRPRRKLAGMPERIMLPDRKDLDQAGLGGNRRPKIVLALDTSGSIPKEKVVELLDLANSIPKRKVDVICCTFADDYVKLDIDKSFDDQTVAWGGTDFYAISEFVRDHAEQDTHVIVITDGHAEFGYYESKAAPVNLNTHWHWLVFPTPYIKDRRVTENIYSYKDYVS